MKPRGRVESVVYATYNVFIDWDNDQGTFLSDFESNLDGWEVGGGIVPTISRVDTPVYSGNWAMEVDWPSFNPFQFDVSGRGFSQGRFGPDSADGPDLELSYVFRDVPSFIVGREYTMTMRVYIPSGSPHVIFSVEGEGTATSTINDVWETLVIAFTATDTQHQLRVTPVEEPENGGIVYVDYVTRVGADENITDRVLASRTPLEFTYGRDQIRSLTSMAPGQLDMEVDNQSRDYSPNNPSSPVAGFLAPGREVFVEATYNDTVYNLFRGYLYDYQIFPEPLQRSVRFTALDMFAKLESVNLSTEVIPSAQTGEILHYILDQIGWPQDARDIDPGATTVRWWHEEDVTALEAVEKIVRSEGLAALAYVNAFNIFVFRDRHHRLIDPRSLVSQNTLHGDEDLEPGISAPFQYDIGWKDVFNTVDVTVEELQPSTQQVVWDDDTEYTLSGGESLTLYAVFNQAVIDAVTPVAGIDYVVLSGTPRVTISRTSGKSIEITVTAIGGPAIFTGLALRANPIVTARSFRIISTDPGSIDQNGIRVYNDDMPWANRNDVQAISEVILGHRSDRLPVITFDINNGTDERMLELLERELSDRVHVTEEETFTDDDFYVEKITHSIRSAGLHHVTTYGCEQVRTQVDNVFTFDDPDRGFDDGVFGYSGLSNPDTLFILGDTNLGEGFLGY